MSHVTTGGICVTSLDDVEAALAKFPGAELRRGQKTFEWFGRFLNDWDDPRAAVNQGFDCENFGKCEHAIHVDGVEYEVGLCKRANGEEGFDLVYDVYGNGQKLENRLGGLGLADFKVEVGMNAAERVYADLGYACEREKLEDGRKQLVLTR